MVNRGLLEKLKKETYGSWLACGTHEAEASKPSNLWLEWSLRQKQECGRSLVRRWSKTYTQCQEIVANCLVAQEGKVEPHSHGLLCGRVVLDLNWVYSLVVKVNTVKITSISSTCITRRR